MHTPGPSETAGTANDVASVADAEGEGGAVADASDVVVVLDDPQFPVTLALMALAFRRLHRLHTAQAVTWLGAGPLRFGLTAAVVISLLVLRNVRAAGVAGRDRRHWYVAQRHT